MWLQKGKVRDDMIQLMATADGNRETKFAHGKSLHTSHDMHACMHMISHACIYMHAGTQSHVKVSTYMHACVLLSSICQPCKRNFISGGVPAHGGDLEGDLQVPGPDDIRRFLFGSGDAQACV